ncbi:MAG: DNA primase [Hyphomicrobiaceae bacterium]
MRYPPHILDEIRARLDTSSVVGRKVRLRKQGREYVGLSPFKTEKSPSFFVNDQKRFYHCFASGEHGDIFTFLMKTEGLSFPEAVERLAAEAGVALPRAEPEAIRREQARVELCDVLAEARAYFREQLQTRAGADARTYLERRGLSAATIEAFGIGFAPNGRSETRDALMRRGLSEALLVDAGLLVSGPEIARPYDRFRNRVMFPICDLRGRVIAFGGRALDPDQPAKYLNSPETAVFHKGHVLFNANRARQVAHDTGRLVVVEGYMDVAALDQAGLKAAVAPLGTALTQDQLGLLWRMAPEPILCFDGDGAGTKAAYRAIDVALAHLKPGVSLRFAFLPDGQDPDDFVRRNGRVAFEALLDQAKPMSAVLWEREFLSGDWQTPERKAMLERRLNELTGTITDPVLRSHYQRDMRGRLFEALRVARTGQGTTRGPVPGPFGVTRRTGAAPARTTTASQSLLPLSADIRPRTRSLASSSLVIEPRSRDLERIAQTLALVAEVPELLDDHAEELAELPIGDARLAALRDQLLDAHANENPLDTPKVLTQLARMGWSDCLDLFRRALAAIGSDPELHSGQAGSDHGAVQHAAPPSSKERDTRVAWSRVMMLNRAADLRDELERALQDFDQGYRDEDAERIAQLRQALSKLEAMEHEPDDRVDTQSETTVPT